MTDGVIEAVLRRDRAIVAAALFVLAGLAWAYVLWLAAGMDMGGMDMSSFRMIPAGVVLMMAANVPWNATPQLGSYLLIQLSVCDLCDHFSLTGT
jgi:predicted metal-binding membrane protein